MIMDKTKGHDEKMGQDRIQTIETKEGVFECNVDSTLMPGLTRMITGTTPFDSEIDTLAIPLAPLWLNAVVRVLRWYQSNISCRLGHRCVYEPSCSHYSELSFRKYGFTRGFNLTIQRLIRCRPGYGGIDLP